MAISKALQTKLEYVSGLLDKKNKANIHKAYQLLKKVTENLLSCPERRAIVAQIDTVGRTSSQINKQIEDFRKLIFSDNFSEKKASQIKTLSEQIKTNSNNLTILEKKARALFQKQMSNPENYTKQENQENQTQNNQNQTPEQTTQRHTTPNNQNQEKSTPNKPTQTQQNNTNAYKANDLDDLSSIFKNIANEINQSVKKQTQTEPIQPTQQVKQTSQPQENPAQKNKEPATNADKDLKKEQIDDAKESIKTQEAFIKEAKSFLKTLSFDEEFRSFNNPQNVEKIEAFLSAHDIDTTHSEMDDLLNALQNAQVDAMMAKQEIGYAYIHKSGENEELDGRYELNTDTTPPKTFKSTKGVETTYQHFNNNNNTAIISFEPPINEIDHDESEGLAVSYNPKTGAKSYTGHIKKSNVNGVSVKVGQNGLINFKLPENKELLSHPEVISKLITMYPESFKTLPPVVYAFDPKLFAESFKKGTIDKAKSNAIGKQNIEDYYLNADFDLSEMNDRALSTTVNKSKMEEEALKIVSKQVQIEEGQLGE